MSFVYKKHFTWGDGLNYLLLAIVSLVSLFPFFYILSISLTDPDVYIPLQLRFIPAKFSLRSYRYILSTNFFSKALMNTVYLTLMGTLVNVVVTFTGAYALTKKEVPGHRFITVIIIFSMLFYPGLVPNYMLIKNLGLIDSYWALILSAATSSWNVIVVRNFMNELPKELEQSAAIDGCNDLVTFIRIVLPLSMAALATFILFFAVAHWNTYMNAVLYLNDSDKWTLQVLVKSMIVDADVESVGSAAAAGEDQSLPQETVRMASVILTMLPIVVVYPFLQRYFVKGVMVGALKG